MLLFVLFSTYCWFLARVQSYWLLSSKGFVPASRRPLSSQQFPPKVRNQKKPPWVTDKVLYIKAMTGAGCGKVAETFNRLYGDKETVSKTFVYYKIKQNQYRLRALKRSIRNRPPRTVPINQTWAMDLTTVTLSGKQKTILGIIDHGSRLALKLEALQSQGTWHVLQSVCAAIKQFGMPKSIRTDNGACFTSKTMTVTLRLLGIKHQRTNVAAPWQNGKVERLFGTFKPLFKQAGFAHLNAAELQVKLDVYSIWYNQLRTHENLNGLTPEEAWLNKPNRSNKKAILASGWDGVLMGFYKPK